MASLFIVPDMDACFIGMCLEGFLYGLYSGIFAMYLKFQSNKSRKATIVFYALCLLYILSTVTVVIDLAMIILQLSYDPNSGVSNDPNSRVIINPFGSDDPAVIPNDGGWYTPRWNTNLNGGYPPPAWTSPSPTSVTPPVTTTSNATTGIVQTLASGLCDFIAQSILIYRCWIVWDQNIRVVIIPSFLAIAYIAIWLSSESQLAFAYNINTISPPSQKLIWSVDKWSEGSMGTISNLPYYDPSIGYGYLPSSSSLNPVIITSFALSIAVNTLVTGLIVFKILKVFLEVKPTTDERALGATGGTKLRHIIFIIIESGMALFAIQLVRVVLSCLPLQPSTALVFNLTTGINQMFNGITPTIILVRVTMRLSIEDNKFFKEAVESLCFNNPPSDPDTLQRVTVGRSSMQPQESPEETQRPGSGDICFNNPPSNPNTLRRMESSSSTPPQERIENTTE